MNGRNRVRIVLTGGLSAGALMFGAASAQAQATDASAPVAPAAEAAASIDSNEIIVTAQRRAERLENVPVAITAMSGAALERSGITRITDLGQIAAGAQVNRAGAFTQPSIRGVTTLTLGFGFENNVAVYVDGFYQPDAVSISSDLANLSSLQVLKGPQGALYGRNATAGAIVIDTLAPSNELTGNGQISYGRFNDKRLKGYISGPISDKIAFSLAGYYRHGDGYIRDIGNNPTSSADDYDAAPVRNASVRAKLQLKPVDGLTVTLGYNHTYVFDSRGLLYTINRYASPAIPTPPARANQRDTASSNLRADGSVRADEFTGVIKFDTDIGTLSSYTGYAKRLSHSNFDFDGSKAPITASISENIGERTFQQTLDYSINAIDNLDLVVGAFYYRDRLTVKDGRAFSGVSVLRHQFIFLESDAMAAYVDATWNLAENLFLTGGARYSVERRRIRYFETQGDLAAVLPAPPADKNADFSALTPRAVLRYELAPRTNVYASYSQGFRSGVFNPTVVASAAFVIPVNPEKIKSYEIGFKTASSRFRFDTAAYYLDYRNLQVGVTIPSPVNPLQVIQAISNAKRAESYGIEAQAAYTPVEDLNLRVGAAYIHARYKDFKNATGTGLNSATQTNVAGQVQDWSGQQMARAPSFTANTGFDYTIDLAGGRLQFSGNASYTTSYVVANPSLFGPLAGAALANKQRYRQNGYAIFNAQANWTDPSDHFTLGVYGENLGNKRYNFVLSGGTFGDYSQAIDPISYGVRAGFKF